jgi:hypothetical protein
VSTSPIAPPGNLAFEGKFQWLTRIGFAARGLLYILIAVLVFRTGRTEDLTGALEYFGGGDGKPLLIGIAAGLAAYGLWRLADAAFGMETPGTSWKIMCSRVARAFIGFIYLFLAYKAARVLLAGRAGTADIRDHTRDVLDLPGGDMVLGVAALVMLIAGLNQLRKAWECEFLNRLSEGAGQQSWVKWFGRLGYAARGVIFFVVAYLLGRAALDHNAAEAGGLEQALDFLSPPIESAIAAGLFLFGIFSLVEARYRRIHRPPVERIEQEVREKVAS